MAFFATFNTGRRGLYTGSDLVANKVIETGDPLFGDTVVILDIDTGGLNDAGQIAFYFELANGTRGIARRNSDPSRWSRTRGPGPVVPGPVVPGPVVPGPSTLTSLGIGLVALALVVRRKVRG